MRFFRFNFFLTLSSRSWSMTPIILWSLNESNATSRWERQALSTVSLAAARSEAAATVYSLSIYTAYFCLERHTRTRRLCPGAPVELLCAEQ